MQQTETYKLNLIETSDTFSPDPLNQNTQKIEEVMSAETAQRAAGDEALSSRVTALELHKIAYGTYTGNNTNRTFQVGFTPQAVLIMCERNGLCGLAYTGQPSKTPAISIITGGFSVLSSASVNSTSLEYQYMAFN